MANNKKFNTKNGLTTQNVEFTSPDGTKIITLAMGNDDKLSFTGDNGELFSVADVASGTIFAVNDTSGIPSIEVYDDGTIRLAETSGNILIGSATDNGSKLQLTGNATASGNITAADFIRPSDERLKTDVSPLLATAKLNPVRFTLVETGNADFGFLAGQVEENYPEAVKEFVKDGVVYKAVAYDKLTAVLAAQLNYAMTQIEELRKEIDEIKKAND